MAQSSLQLRKFDELNGKTFLIGVGANKCATSWIFHYFRSLPEITVSPLKELHFFNAKVPPPLTEPMDQFAFKRLAYHVQQDGDVVDNLRNRPAFQASLDRVSMIYDDNAYFAHFARWSRAETKTFCDITPAYSALNQDGFDYMKRFIASQHVALKIFFVMRDPVDRLWSHMRYRDKGDDGSGLLKSWSKWIEDPEFMAWANYKHTVEVLEGMFPAEDLLFLFYEDLFSEASLKTLCAFAGADHRPPQSEKAVNETFLKLDLPGPVRDQLQARLRPQYEFCHQRFGDRVPASWLNP